MVNTHIDGASDRPAEWIYTDAANEFITRTRKPNPTWPFLPPWRRLRKSMAAVLRSWQCGKARCRAECTRIIASPREMGRLIRSFFFSRELDISCFVYCSQENPRKVSIQCHVFSSFYRGIIPSAVSNMRINALNYYYRVYRMYFGYLLSYLFCIFNHKLCI